MRTIDDAIEEMDDEIGRAVASDDPHGYFAVMYRAVTARVRDGIRRGEFDDPDRMERFDVVFARHYVEARRRWRVGERVPESWRVTFETAARGDRIIGQHLLLGINAHINHDLGLAAIEAADGDLLALRDDFERINDVLAELVDRMQDALAALSPWSRVVDLIGLRLDEALVCFNLRRARREAWEFALELGRSPSSGRAEIASRRDREVAALGARIASPSRPLDWAVRVAHRRERHDLAAIASALRR